MAKSGKKEKFSIDKLRPLFRSFEKFALAFWRIYDKSGKLVKFRPNPAQQVMLAKAESQRVQGRPVRLRVLKYRQAGASMLWTMYALWLILTRNGFTALTIADKKDLPTQWLRRCQALYQQIHPAFRKMIGRPKASSANEVFFSDRQARYYIGSAEGTTPGMGATIAFVHCSEKASWRDSEAIMSDLVPAVPPGRNTWIVEESTGRSIGDLWYRDYMEARRGESEYLAVFLPWFIQPEYTREATWEDLGALTEKETALIAACEEYRTNGDGSLIDLGPITPGQIAWRRYMVATEFHGDDDRFANQFPSTEHEAFLAGGLSVFTPEQVAEARQTVKKPLWRGDVFAELSDSDSWRHDALEWQYPDRYFRYRLEPNESGECEIYQEPQAEFHYALGADCQWGVKDTADYDVLYVECLETRRVCARVRGRYDLAEWGKIIAALGYHYNTCPVAPERNAKAAEALMPLLLGNVSNWSYPRIWIRSTDTSFRGSYRLQDYGWYTDEHSKGDIIAYAKSATLAGRFDWSDAQAVDEMEAYIRDEKGNLTAPEGNHDDCLMARMITAYVAHRERQHTELYVPRSPVSPMTRCVLTPMSVRIAATIARYDRELDGDRHDYEDDMNGY